MTKRGWLVAWVGSVGALIACGNQAVDYPDGTGTGDGGAVVPGLGNGSACSKDGDCKGICQDGKCASCASSAQCKDPTRPVCDPGSGTCGGCTTTSQCSPGLACVNGACSACTSNSQCLAGQACINGACGACTTNTQCGGLEQCINGQCTSPSDGGAGPTLESGVDACAAGYVGFVGPVGSVWGNATTDTVPGFGANAGGKTSMAAGNNACNVAYAGSHVCTWLEVKASDVCGKLAGLKNTAVTAWMTRTNNENGPSDDNPALPAGNEKVANQASPGSTCNLWTYPTNHAYDGEWIEFGGGAMKPHYDSDTSDYGGVAGVGIAAGALNCNGESRDVLCCK